MKYILPFLFVLFCSSSNAQTVTFIGDQAHGYKQLWFSSTNSAPSADSAQPEITMFAWTCNSLGFPICNGRTVFKYNLASIPTNAVVTNAKLYLFAKTTNINGQSGNPTFGTANACYLQKVISSWAPVTTGWATQPSVTTTNQKTLPQSTSTAQNYVVDVTDFVQFWVNKPDSNFGAFMRLQNEQYYNSMIFHSGQAPLESLKPKLEVTYTTALPLTVKSFTVRNSGQSNLLEWYLASKEDLFSIEIERSQNAKDFNRIAVVASQATSVNGYQYNDANIKEGEKLFYRLKLIKKDGGVLYSQIIVALSSNNNDFQIFPNPAKKDFQISLKSSVEAQTTIRIQNTIGQTIHIQVASLKKGYNSIAVSTKLALSPGLYIVSMTIDNEQLQQKLIVQ